MACEEHKDFVTHCECPDRIGRRPSRHDRVRHCAARPGAVKVGVMPPRPRWKIGGAGAAVGIGGNTERGKRNGGLIYEARPLGVFLTSHPISLLFNEKYIF